MGVGQRLLTEMVPAVEQTTDIAEKHLAGPDSPAIDGRQDVPSDHRRSERGDPGDETTYWNLKLARCVLPSFRLRRVLLHVIIY